MAFFLLLPFLLTLPSIITAQSQGIIALGAYLNATPDAPGWSSASGDFSFGFKQLGNDDLYLLAIWFAKIPDRTVVWFANDGSPAPRGSKLELIPDRGLLLTDSQGHDIWKSDIGGGVVVRAVMNDSGNFVIEGVNSSKLWQSFENLTDTILPTQMIGRGAVLSSRLTETNYSKGRFQLRFLRDGNIVMNSINLPSDYSNEPYFNSSTGAASSVNPGEQFSLNETGFLYILRENGDRTVLTPARKERLSAYEFYYRATLNFDGVFALYYHPRNSGNNGIWVSSWFKPDDICISVTSKSSGICGYNSICYLNSDSRPVCECPPGYSLLRPYDPYGGCKSGWSPSCEEDEIRPDLYSFQTLINTDWPLGDYEALSSFSEDQCLASCLHDCLCAVAIYRLGNTCWKKKLPLSNGQKNNMLYGKAFMKVRKDNSTTSPDLPSPENRSENQETLNLAVAVILGASVFANFLLISAVCLWFFFVYRRRDLDFTKVSSVETNLQCFTFKQLEEATEGFKEELGRGAFGIVYRGELRKGSGNFVAVKKLNSSVQDGEKEFRTEVNVIGQTHHKNLVRLLGFCDKDLQRLLVYEYMGNGTLASFLFGELKPSWKQRIHIALGISRGLLYLHEECRTQIIHCDIKPQNILLDDYYNAKISDFGLAKLLMMNQSQTQTAIRGTKGYVAPEWFRNMPITAKVDVYSYGVLLLEIICCRRSVEVQSSEKMAILTDWAYDCYRKGALEKLIEFEFETLEEKKTLERFVKVSIWCIQEDVSLRPAMKTVSQMLDGVVEVPIPPCPFPFPTATSYKLENTETSELNRSSSGGNYFSPVVQPTSHSRQHTEPGHQVRPEKPFSRSIWGRLTRLRESNTKR